MRVYLWKPSREDLQFKKGEEERGKDNNQIQFHGTTICVVDEGGRVRYFPGGVVDSGDTCLPVELHNSEGTVHVQWMTAYRVSLRILRGDSGRTKERCWERNN